MTVRRKIETDQGMFFLSMTCNLWLPLFEITNGYDFVYKQFDVLKIEGHFINAYVIMPNHLHFISTFRKLERNINLRISDFKIFLARDILKSLRETNQNEILEILASSITPSERKQHKSHRVFTPSFDWKECWSRKFILQKLNYIHQNPCTGKWNLALSPIDYLHSSAKFYETGVQGIYPVTHFLEMEDVSISS